MSGIRLRIGCERKAVVLFGLASEPVLQFLHGRKICAKKTQSIEIIAEYYIIQLSRLRLLDCLSCFVEQLQGEQAVDKDCVREAIVGGKVEALAIRLPCLLMLPLLTVHVAQIEICSVVSRVACNLLLICLCRFIQFPGYARIVVGGDGQLFSLAGDRKSTRLNSSHSQISYAVFCL